MIEAKPINDPFDTVEILAAIDELGDAYASWTRQRSIARTRLPKIYPPSIKAHDRFRAAQDTLVHIARQRRAERKGLKAW